MKMFWCALVVPLVFAVPGRGQDLASLVEQAPVVSAILAKCLERLPAFSGRLEIEVTDKSDPTFSRAAGTLEFEGGKFRCEARLDDVSSAQLTSNARTVVRQINGDTFLLLSRSDQAANYFVLPGAQAYIEEPLPQLKYLKRSGTTVTQTIEGHVCSPEAFAAITADGATNDIVAWKARDFKNIPLMIQVTDAGEVFRIRLKAIQFRKVSADRFQVPPGLVRHNSMDDLVQSVLLDRLKRRMGLE